MHLTGCFGQGMFPNADDSPSDSFELTAHSAVPKFVGRNLRVPELSICLRTLGTLRATVPKAAIKEDDKLLSWETAVWRSHDAQVSAPSRDTR